MDDFVHGTMSQLLECTGIRCARRLDIWPSWVNVSLRPFVYREQLSARFLNHSNVSISKPIIYIHYQYKDNHIASSYQSLMSRIIGCQCSVRIKKHGFTCVHCWAGVCHLESAVIMTRVHGFAGTLFPVPTGCTHASVVFDEPISKQ